MRVASWVIASVWVIGGCGDVITDPDHVDVTISPSAPKTADDLVATADAANNSTLRWLKNGTIADAVTGTQVAASLTAKGETWTVEVVSSKGEVLGTDQVTIGNTAPGAFDIEVQLDAGTGPVPCAIVTPPTDDDGDPLMYSATWLRNGVTYPGAMTTMFMGDTVPMTDHVPGDQFECTVTATDGTEMVTAFAAARVLVPNGVAATGTIQMFTTPNAPAVVIEAAGGVGGENNSILGSVNGARMIGTFALPAGTILKILVGQPAGPDAIGTQNLSGGGGTFVLSATDAPFLIAGGGGSHFSANPAVTETQGRAETSGGTMGTTARADNGMGGNIEPTSTSGAGGGLLTSGVGVGGGSGYMQGAAGGAGPAPAETARGGYGGGGARGGSFGQGAGGGYSGGSCGDTSGSWVGCGGGGSFNTGTNQVNTTGANPGAGYVKFSW